MTPAAWFWTALAVFVALIVAWLTAVKVYLAVDKRRNVAAIPAPVVEPVDDLDAKWDAFWRERDLEFRRSDLWQRLHADDTADLDEEIAALKRVFDETEKRTAEVSARMADRAVRRCGYAGLVDMTAQWIHARRRSIPRMVAILDKTGTWPDGWRRQLDVLLAEGAVARARKEAER